MRWLPEKLQDVETETVSLKYKRKKVSGFYCPSVLLFSCAQDTVKNCNNNDQSIKAWHHPCSFFPSKKIFPYVLIHPNALVFMTGLALLFSSRRAAGLGRVQQRLVAISPLIPAVSVLPRRCLSSTRLAAESRSKRMTKAAIGTKPSFLLDSPLLPAVPHVAGRASPLWNRGCWK